MKLDVCIVEDDAGLRSQLSLLVSSTQDLNLRGAFRTGEEALARIPVVKPDVVLMDINLPGMSGIECVAALRRVLPDLRIVMLTVYEDSGRIFDALKSGASGYLVKSSPPDQILEAIQDAFAGGAPMSSHIARKVVQYFYAPLPEARNTEEVSLSPREREVLDLLSKGLYYKEIADQLGIGVETVRTYVKNICQKMHVRSRIDAIARYISK